MSPVSVSMRQPVAAALEGTPLEQGRDGLLDEERVALGARQHHLEDVAPRGSAEQLPYQLKRLGAPERLQAKIAVLRARKPKPGRRAGQFGPGGGDQEQRTGGLQDGPLQEVEQVVRCPVRSSTTTTSGGVRDGADPPDPSAVNPLAGGGGVHAGEDVRTECRGHGGVLAEPLRDRRSARLRRDPALRGSLRRAASTLCPARARGSGRSGRRRR